jgi:hypothetical protein
MGLVRTNAEPNTGSLSLQYNNIRKSQSNLHTGNSSDLESDNYLRYSIGRLEPYTPLQPSAMIRVLPGLQNSSSMVQSMVPAILTLDSLKPLDCRPYLS